jgi:uncharacterized protein with ParB-like and HNH nuclease domain
MKIKLHEIPIRDIVADYTDSQEEGVIGYGGKLDIRPKYQRNFIYKEAQRNAVIETVKKNFPLNVMYWVKNDENFEVLDGQQRTISICQYVKGDFSLDYQYFHNLTDTDKEQILNYKLMIYFCEGNDKEKLGRFKTINIAGEKLTDQELRNAIYTGEWLTDAKRYFSKNNCAGYLLGKDYLNGIAIRQDYLETAIKWLSKGNIEEYMATHQHDQNANELWTYFQNVINRIQLTFTKYRKEMKGIERGYLYNDFKNQHFNTDDLEKEITKLMQDDDITKKSGIYEYLLRKQEKFLNIRAFTDNMKREAYERQQGICIQCGNHFDLNAMEADHITPRVAGGKTNAENCQMLCKECNRRKSDK